MSFKLDFNNSFQIVRLNENSSIKMIELDEYLILDESFDVVFVVRSENRMKVKANGKRKILDIKNEIEKILKRKVLLKIEGKAINLEDLISKINYCTIKLEVIE